MAKITSIQDNSQTGKTKVNLESDKNTMDKQFATYYQEHVTRVYRYIYSKVGNAKEAEDLTSQTFLAALENFSKFQNKGSFAAWLFSIARNKVIDEYRRNEKLLFIADMTDYLKDSQDVLGTILETEQITQLNNILTQLSLEQIELLQLRYAAALSFAEIGIVIGRSEAAAKMAVYRLQEHLREKLEKNYVDQQIQ